MKHLLLIYILVFLSAHTSQSQTTKKVLFIGNSYTYVNDLPGIINDIAISKGNTFNHQSHTPGGSTLAQHASNSTVQNLLYSEVWDYVILQDQSQNPSFPPSQVANEVYPYAASLCEDIRQADACSLPVYFMTWGRENGDAQNCVNAKKYEQIHMTQKSNKHIKGNLNKSKQIQRNLRNLIKFN